MNKTSIISIVEFPTVQTGRFLYHSPDDRIPIVVKMNSEGLGEYLTRAFNGHTITQRPSDGYINATQMCKVQKSKKLNDWSRTKDTHAFLKALGVNTGIPVLELVISEVGGDHSGSWIHPKAAIHMAD